MKKILFYGNCQLGALSKHIRNSSDEYQILNCEDYGLKKFWTDKGVFATWSLENKDNQDEYYPKIIDAVKNCDIFIFQHHKDLVRRTELTTQLLLNELNDKSIGICLPSFRYFGYLYSTDMVNYVVKKLYEQGVEINDIIDYLKNEDDNDARNQMIENHNYSLNKLKQKDKENEQLYKNYISISDFIESNYKTKLMAYDHSHPSIHYYNQIIKLLLKYDIKIDEILDETLPGSSQLCPYDLKYFNNHFPELEDRKKHNLFFRFRLNEENIERQIALIEKGRTE